MMALQLSMVGLTVQDMEKSKEFYRRLGLAVPEENPKQPRLMITMEGEFTLFLAPGSIQSEQAASDERIENYRVLPWNMVDNSTSSCEGVSGWNSSVDCPDRPPLFEMRLHPSASTGTFTDCLTTWHTSPSGLCGAQAETGGN